MVGEREGPRSRQTVNIRETCPVPFVKTRGYEFILFTEPQGGEKEKLFVQSSHLNRTLLHSLSHTVYTSVTIMITNN